MKKNLFLISEEEKNRILGMHESATKRGYLTEQAAPSVAAPSVAAPSVAAPSVAAPSVAAPAVAAPAPVNSEMKVLNDGDYVYKKEGEKYFFKLQPSPRSEQAKKLLAQKKFVNFTEATGKGLEAIKKLNWGQSEKLAIKPATPITNNTTQQLAGTTPAAGTTTAVTATNPQIIADLKSASDIRQEFRQGKRDQRKLKQQYDKMYATYNKLSDKMDKATDKQYLDALYNLKSQLG